MVFCSVAFSLGVLLVLVSEMCKAVSQRVNDVLRRLGRAELRAICCSFPVRWPVPLVFVSQLRMLWWKDVTIAVHQRGK